MARGDVGERVDLEAGLEPVVVGRLLAAAGQLCGRACPARGIELVSSILPAVELEVLVEVVDEALEGALEVVGRLVRHTGEGVRTFSGCRALAARKEFSMADEQRGRIRVEDGPKRVRAYLGGELVADTTRPKLVWEIPYYPAYYLPLDDVRTELL